jgi:hypothetical protein
MGNDTDLAAEFDRQLGVLLQLGYPDLAGLSASAFTAVVDPLREVVTARATAVHTVPFVLVVSEQMVAAEALLPTCCWTSSGATSTGACDRRRPCP